MRRLIWIGALLLVTAATGRVHGGDAHGCNAVDSAWLQRWHPVGGWEPYGGGLVHWWNPHCFPCYRGPDDYCRKSLPGVCWPAYPPYFQLGPPACAAPQANCYGPAAKPK